MYYYLAIPAQESFNAEKATVITFILQFQELSKEIK